MFSGLKHAVRLTALASAGLAAAFAAPASIASETAEARTWYVYCEGHGHGMSWAVFSQNFWPHSGHETYGRALGSAAETFIEAKYDVMLSDCSGVNFFDPASAEYSRDRTELLHRKLGDQVFFFDLPDEVIDQ